VNDRTGVVRVSDQRRLQRQEVIYAAIGVGATFPATPLVAAVVAGPAFYRYGFTAWTAPALLALAGATVDVRYPGQRPGRWGRWLLYGAALIEALTTVVYSPRSVAMRCAR
jgi:hypothetical protein